MGEMTFEHESTLFMCSLYIILGFVSIIFNCINLSIYLSNKLLLRKYLYFCALDFGELVNGVSYVLVGSGRLMALLGGYVHENMTVHECFYHRFWPHSLILGTELPSYCILLISAERFFALMKPSLYNKIFIGKYKTALLGAVPIAGITSVIVAGYSATGDEGKRVIPNQLCPIISSTARWYSTYHFTTIVIVYILSFFCLLLLKYRTRKYAKKRSKDSRIGLMLTITGTSILLIGSSSYVMLQISWNFSSFDNVVVAITYAMPGFLSVTNTIINMTFRQELRLQLLYILGIRTASASYAVSTALPKIPATPRKPGGPFRALSARTNSSGNRA